MKKKNIVMTRRTYIRLISFTLAAFLILLVRNFQLMKERNRDSMALTNNYSRAISDLAEACDNLSATLEKELYAGTSAMHRDLATKLYRESSSAKAALSQLPIEELQLENTYKFLSQVGNYSLSLSEKLNDKDELTDREYANIEKLYNFASKLKDDMWALDNSIEQGEISFEKAKNNIDSQSDTPKVTDGFVDFEDGFDDYPTLIYDGPFSDNIMERTPRMTENESAKRITQDKALSKAGIKTNINPSDFTRCEKVSGKMPGWRFSDDKNTVTCEITENGGYLSYMLKSRLVQNSSIDKKTAVEKAKKYLDDMDVLSMQVTYYDIGNNIMTVNFAYNDSGVCVYPDLIKVSVAMDNGEIMGVDARGYLTNHYERSYSQKLISADKAEKKVSPKLKVKSKGLAVIPTDNLKEKLCYEFKCSSKNGRNVLVYINAENGNEEQILILIESENGVLTM